MDQLEKQGIAALDYLNPIIVFLTDLSESSGYSIKTQTSLHQELKGRYSDYPWIDVYSKSDLESKETPDYPDPVTVSVMEGKGIDVLKDRLIGSANF